MAKSKSLRKTEVVLNKEGDEVEGLGPLPLSGYANRPYGYDVSQNCSELVEDEPTDEHGCRTKGIVRTDNKFYRLYNIVLITVIS